MKRRHKVLLYAAGAVALVTVVAFAAGASIVISEGVGY